MMYDKQLLLFQLVLFTHTRKKKKEMKGNKFSLIKTDTTSVNKIRNNRSMNHISLQIN